jgi:tetratricopeptide (TPR) repeat protein
MYSLLSVDPAAAQDSAEPPQLDEPGLILPVPNPDLNAVPDSRDEAELLRQLADADEAGAKRIDRQLQALWSQSGSPAMDLLLKRGRDAMEVQDTRTAIEHLTALTDHAPEFAEGFHMRASAYFSAELLGPAIADLERALALNPNNYNAIYGLGAILETLGDEARAYQAYERVIALHPYHAEATAGIERLRIGIEGRAL